MYTWKHKETGEEVDVQRTFDESNLPPDDSGNWEKVLGNFRLIRGPNWNGSKGNW